jgi:hypothetical protein
MEAVLGSIAALAFAGAFIAFVVGLWNASGKLAHKGIDAMDAVKRIDDRMSGRPLPPPPPGAVRR